MKEHEKIVNLDLVLNVYHHFRTDAANIVTF